MERRKNTLRENESSVQENDELSCEIWIRLIFCLWRLIDRLYHLECRINLKKILKIKKRYFNWEKSTNSAMKKWNNGNNDYESNLWKCLGKCRGNTRCHSEFTSLSFNVHSLSDIIEEIILYKYDSRVLSNILRHI